MINLIYFFTLFLLIPYSPQENEIRCSSILLIDENEFFLGEDFSTVSETIFLLNDDYNIDSVSIFCQELVFIYENEESRRIKFFKESKDGIGWKKSEQIIEEMKYPVLLNKCNNYETFEKLSQGTVLNTITFENKRYSLLFPEEDTIVYHKFYIIEHVW